MATAKTETKDKPKTDAPIAGESQSKGAVATLGGFRLPYPVAFQERFKIGPSQFGVLVDSIFPTAKTVDAIGLALAYCKTRKLDIFKRPVHIVPIYSSVLGMTVESVWPGINELRTTAMRTREYAGCDETAFGPMVTREFKGKKKEGKGDAAKFEEVKLTVTFPQWARVTVYRMVQGQRVPFPGPTIYYESSFGQQSKWCAVPNEKWERSGSYMLEKCAEAAALRKAFPEEIGNQQAAEEMEGRVVDLPDGNTAIVPEAETKTAGKKPDRADYQTGAGSKAPIDQDGEGNNTDDGKPEKEGFDLVDNLGEVKETIADPGIYAVELGKLFDFMATTKDQKGLETALQNNQANIGRLEGDIKAGVIEAYSAALSAISAKAKAADPKKGAAPAEGGKKLL